jgi:hypothetical protein
MKKLLQILSVYLLLVSTNINAQKGKDSYSSASVLSSGEWFRIALTSDGIYRIDYSRLKQLGLTDPSDPKIFGNNSGQLSYYNDDPKPDDLKELAIYTITGSDNIFNEGDYLLFYGQGVNRWVYNDSTKEFDYLRHNYSDTAFYFITSGSPAGKRVQPATEPATPVTYNTSQSDVLFIHDHNEVNLIKSGRDWFQEISNVAINPGFTGILVSEKIKYRIRVAARASGNTLFRLFEGASLKKSIQVQGVNLNNFTGTYAQITDSTGSILPESSSPSYEIKYFNNGEAGTHGWLDYISLQARKLNSFTGSIIQFTDSRSVAPGRITEFSILAPGSDMLLWDVSDPFNAKQIDKLTRNGDNLTFRAATDSLKTFIAFSTGNVLSPTIKPVAIPNQDLHASDPAEMIILTHPLFKTYAERLALIHQQESGLISQIVTPEQVYNEFSGGVADIAALRNFVRMKYMKQKESNHPLKYLLLFGDGSFENKILPPDNPNFIPTYQSQNSNVYVSSYTSDDFYGLLEDGEGEVTVSGESQLIGSEDIGIGRLPVSDTVQAGILLSKIVKYLDPANMGDWKNNICITADDEDGNTHMSDAEGLSSLLNDSVPAFNIQKIYLDSYRQTTAVNGQSYPEVNKAINEHINAGCLIFNYVGHGNEGGLAHERVVKTEDINSWRNSAKLPLFITATCEFSRFDDIELNTASGVWTGKPSAGEMVLLKSDGGGIALMSTTRVVYSAPNYTLNKNIYEAAFDRDGSGNTLTLGDIMKKAKNNSGNGPNKRNFSLLGDPALKLAYPWFGKVVTDSINNVSVSEQSDSLKALSVITVAGHLEYPDGTMMTTFNGIVSPIVFDKPTKIKTLANDGGQILEFSLINNILFSGKTMANNGKFRFTFIVPRDIDYSFGKGKISYYASGGDEDMNGSFNGIVVGGFSETALTDKTGPEINLYLNDTLFRNGGITDDNPKLLATIKDTGGINTTGSGIGHDITGYLDNDPNKSFVLNNYYVTDFDNYQKGKITYNLTGLSKGSHSITVKAWDNFNNSAEKSIIFHVEAGGKFVLKNLFNYPNPFFNETTFFSEHNRPDEKFLVTVNIYNLNGRIIKIIRSEAPSTGYVLPHVSWDGNDDGGHHVGRGIYPYTVIVTTEKGEMAKASGRMIIL